MNFKIIILIFVLVLSIFLVIKFIGSNTNPSDIKTTTTQEPQAGGVISPDEEFVYQELEREMESAEIESSDTEQMIK